MRPESPIGEGGLGRDGEGRSSVTKRPLPPIYWSGELKQSIEDRRNVVPREGYNFKKIVSPKSPPGRKSLGRDNDVRSRTRKGSLWSESSYETFPLDPEQRKEDDDQNESKEGSYLPLSGMF